jgi:hypothetical protein
MTAFATVGIPVYARLIGKQRVISIGRFHRWAFPGRRYLRQHTLLRPTMISTGFVEGLNLTLPRILLFQADKVIRGDP